MADNQQNFSVGGINRQEEEVRDLFHYLTQSESEEPKIEEVAKKPVAQTWAIEIPDEEEPQEKEVEQSASNEDFSQDALPTVQQAVVPVVERQSVKEVAVPVEKEPQPPVAAAPPKPRATHAAFVDDYDEDDEYAQLPPLVLTSYEDDWYDDEDGVFSEVEHRFVTTEEQDMYEVDAAPTERRKPLLTFWNALRSNVPIPSDNKREVVRKSVFWTSVLAFVFALTYILYSVWWLPAFTKNMYDGVGDNYHPKLHGVVDSGVYPSQMQLSFQTLYDRNAQTRGWLSFHATGNQDFLNIEYPIMYSGDNEKYLTTDFNGNKNKNGALFFDMRANMNSAEDTNKTLIVYGHNMASGQMLAGLNKFIGNVNNARVAATLTMNTLFANGQYKVFAVVITDESAQKEHYYNIRRTQFNSDEDFLGYIDNVRARSLFNYPIDVNAEDELLLLSTCTVPSSVKIRNGRLTVVARKVRANESTVVDTSRIAKNDDVIMPYAWYTLQNKQPHVYYTNGQIASSTVTTTMDNGTTTFWLPNIDGDNMPSSVVGDESTTIVPSDWLGASTVSSNNANVDKSTSAQGGAPASSVPASVSTTTSSSATTTSTKAKQENTTTTTQETTTTTTTTEETTTTTTQETTTTTQAASE